MIAATSAASNGTPSPTHTPIMTFFESLLDSLVVSPFFSLLLPGCDVDVDVGGKYDVGFPDDAAIVRALAPKASGVTSVLCPGVAGQITPPPELTVEVSVVETTFVTRDLSDAGQFVMPADWHCSAT